MSLPSRTLILCLALLAAGTVPARAVTRRVPSPYARITDALAAAGAGDTIRVAAGVYSPSSNGEVFPLEVFDANVVLLGAGYGNTIVDAETTNAVFHWWPTSGGRISGFTVQRGKTYQGSGIHVIFGTPEIDHNLVIHNYAAHAGSGIFVNEGANPWIHHNVLWENRRAAGSLEDPHGLQVYRAYGTIEHNLIGRGDSNGVFVSAASTSIVRNNIMLQNGTPGDRGRGICAFGTAQSVLRNNLFYGNVIAAVLVLTPQGGQNQTAQQANDYSPTDEIAGNVDGDPLLVDPDHHVWFLQSQSPAVDAGHPASGLDPDGTNPDIGPFYFDQTSSGLPEEPALPVALAPGFPNPFSSAIVLQHVQAAPGHASLTIVDVSGRLVATVLDEDVAAGLVTATWDGRARGGPAPPGIYFAVLRAGGGTFVRKIVRA